jgi:hypothetical protein
MKTIAQILATMTLALAVIAVCVFAAGDRQTLVPPPDAVAEAFVRQAAARRYDRVHALQSSRRQELSAAVLRQYLDPLWRFTGTVNQVDAELVSIEGDHARAVATAYGDLTEARFVFDMVREDGLWKVYDVSTNPMLPPEPPE